MRSLFLPFLFLCSIALSQPKAHDYFIKFRDKNNSEYSTGEPEKFLSQRALERRKRQHIAIDLRDLPVNEVYVQALRDAGIKVLFTSRWFNAATVELRDTTDTVLQWINNQPFVESSRTQRLRKKGDFRIESACTPEALDQAESFSPGEYGASFKQISMCNGNELHSKGFQGNGMLIAIIDAGFRHVDRWKAFGEIRNSGRILATRDFVTDSPQLFASATHGMYVLSAIAGKLPGKLIGTAPEASFLLIRSENDTSEYPVEEDAWVAGAEFADSAGADVINSSLGYTQFDDSLLNHYYSDLDGRTLRSSIAAEIAAEKGMIVVNSAGNEGQKSWHYISAPADAMNILTIGAVDSNRNVTGFSSRGPSYDGRIKPDICAMGGGTIVADTTDEQVVRINGTSLSAPVITGLTACLWQAFPDKTNMEVMEAIRLSADHASRPDADYGYGIPDYNLAYRILKGDALAKDEYLFEISPNPFAESPHLSFYSKMAGTIFINVADETGRSLFSQSFSTNNNSVMQRDLTEFRFLPRGIYLIQLKTDKELICRKVIKD